MRTRPFALLSRRFALRCLLRSARELYCPRWARLAAVSAALLCLLRPAHAEGIRKVSVYVQGTDAQTVRKEIAKLVPAGIEVDARVFGRVLEQSGFVRDPKFDSSSKLGARVMKALSVSNADLAVVARVRKPKANRVAHVLVFRRGESSPQLDETIDLGKKSGSDAELAALSAKLSSLFSAASPAGSSGASAAAAAPAETRPESAAAPAPKSPPEAAADAPLPAPEATPAVAPAASSAKGLPSFVVALALGVGARSFAYKQRVSQNLRPFSLWGIGLAELELEAYPLAKSQGALKNLGLFGSILVGLPARVETEDQTSKTPKAYYDRFSVGLRYRIPLGKSSLGLSGAFSGQDSTFGSAGDLSPSVPSVRYRSLEPALDASISAGPVGLLLGAGYRFVLSGGKLLDRFPQATVGAVDAHLGVTLPLGSGAFALRVITRYERYFYTMHSETPDEYVAGGALDQYFTALGGVSYAF